MRRSPRGIPCSAGQLTADVNVRRLSLYHAGHKSLTHKTLKGTTLTGQHAQMSSAKPFFEQQRQIKNDKSKTCTCPILVIGALASIF